MAVRAQPLQRVIEPFASHSICIALISNVNPVFLKSTAWNSSGGKGEPEPATCVVAACGVAGLAEFPVLLPDFDWLQPSARTEKPNKNVSKHRRRIDDMLSLNLDRKSTRL